MQINLFQGKTKWWTFQSSSVLSTVKKCFSVCFSPVRPINVSPAGNSQMIEACVPWVAVAKAMVPMCVCKLLLERSQQFVRAKRRMLRWNLLLLLFSYSVMSNSVWLHGLQDSRLPCPSPSPVFAQTHVHWVSDAIQLSHPLWSPSPPVLNLSQYQCLFQWVSYLHKVAKVLELHLQH